MRELTPDQQREYERLLAEDRSVTRGRRAALGVMLGAEGGAFGAAIAYASGALWAVGAALGVGVVALVGLVWHLVPRDRLLRFAARQAAPYVPGPEADWSAWQRDGVRNAREPRKPYWPE